MTDSKTNCPLNADQTETVSDGTSSLGVYRPGFQYQEESLLFFKACVGSDVYSKAMNSEAGRAHHYTVVRAFLNQTDWEKFVWIEKYGSLDGFPER